MARVTFRDDELVVCLTGFAFQPTRGLALYGIVGRTYRGDQPIVRQNPEMFAPVGLADDEYGRLRAAIRGERGDRNARDYARVLREEEKAAPKPVNARPWYGDEVPNLFPGITSTPPKS